MKQQLRTAICIAALAIPLACKNSTDAPVPQSQIQSSTIVAGSLPKTFDVKRVYQYDLATVNPESVLTMLLNDGLPVTQAWLPLDNTCMDPVGPRFTVELQTDNSEILKFGFKYGEGRLECATILKHFIITR